MKFKSSYIHVQYREQVRSEGNSEHCTREDGKMMINPNGRSEIKIGRKMFGTGDMKLLVGKITYNCLEEDMEVLIPNGQWKAETVNCWKFKGDV